MDYGPLAALLIAITAFWTPIVIALTELVKRLLSLYKPIDASCLPLIALLLSLVAAFVYIAPGDWRLAILAALVITLESTGLYSSSKALAGK